MSIRKTRWGVHEQRDVYLITLNNAWLELSLTNFGATIVSLTIPDKKGTKKNLVLGYNSLQGYLSDPYYVGSTIGRFANRIAKARFYISDEEFSLAANEQGTSNHLHGGNTGFNKKIFSLKDAPLQGHSVQFYYRSPDSEEGYPGNLDVFVTYKITDNNEVIIDYKAITDMITPVNLTNHSYFNLSGTTKPAINHQLFIDAAYALETGADYIPTGVLKSIAGTDLDFTISRPIHPHGTQVPFRGYNECFSINHTEGPNAVLRDPGSGRSMTVRTTLPGLMLYTGDFLKTPYCKNQGICLETQYFPDSPNHPHFPQTLLHPGEVYQHQTIYQFFD